MLRRNLLALVAVVCGVQAAAGAERLQPPPGAQRPSVRLQRMMQDRGEGSVWGAVDSRRPLIGLELPDSGTDAARMARLRDAVDFVVIDPVPGTVTACEQAGLPWVGRLALGSSTDPVTARSAATGTMDSFADFPNLAGWVCPAESLAT